MGSGLPLFRQHLRNKSKEFTKILNFLTAKIFSSRPICIKNQAIYHITRECVVCKLKRAALKGIIQSLFAAVLQATGLYCAT